MSYKEARILFVDNSPAVGEDGFVWSKLPQKLPPATNLTRTFDTMSWAMTGLAMLTVSLFLMLVGTRDYVDVLIVPIRMLNAELMPFQTGLIKTFSTHLARSSLFQVLLAALFCYCGPSWGV